MDEETIRITVELRPRAGWARLTRGDRVIEIEPNADGDSWHTVEDGWWGKSKPSFAYAFLAAWYDIAEESERPPLWMDL